MTGMKYDSAHQFTVIIASFHACRPVEPGAHGMDIMGPGMEAPSDAHAPPEVQRSSSMPK